MNPWSTILLLGMWLIASFLTTAQAQSISSEEERLRSQLLKLLETPSSVSIDTLRPYYRRPSQIPIRSQKDTDTKSMIELGRKLFGDKRLSSGEAMSCATCHDPKRNWVDGKAKSSEGNGRRSMSLYNIAWDSCFTWHCDAGSLMSQGMLAMTAPRGMKSDPIHAAMRAASFPEYKELFRRAFPRDLSTDSAGHILSAIEYYVSTIVSPTAPFDRWIAGDESAMTPAAKRGFVVFHKQAPCATCHNLWRFSDSRTYDIGIREASSADPPLYKAVGLRNIAERGPYMHDGSLKTLTDVLSFYERGGDVQRSTKSIHIKPFALSAAQRRELLAFLRSLSGAPSTKRKDVGVE